MADGVPNAEPLLFVVIEKNREQVRRYDVLHDGRDAGEQAVEVQRFRGGVGDAQQKVEQLRPFPEPDGGFPGGRRHRLQADIASTICTPELAPIRVAPAASMFRRSSSVRIPPDALTPRSGPTARL